MFSMMDLLKPLVERMSIVLMVVCMQSHILAKNVLNYLCKTQTRLLNLPEGFHNKDALTIQQMGQKIYPKLGLFVKQFCKTKNSLIGG